MKKKVTVLFVLFITSLFTGFCYAQQVDTELDKRVKDFLDSYRQKWVDWNVTYDEGLVLYNIIIQNGYTKALEIGTSTGHSSIWIAWALSKTGGQLITLEIDPARREKALKNFAQAGLSDYIDAQLGDAHQLVKQLPGPFDFVFSDADKVWYKQYFIDLYPKLEVGGCFTAHNVRNPYGGIKEFLDFVQAHPKMDTTIDTTSRSGISISYKRE
ncbi:methyltransferase [candidate division KSB1 bacterium]|nr:class I SAM-dependent methyltransferase [candidate division KSB1 bacterium]RQW03431.1 MAG: methyltransferase [candidate division KSB1 bacterium]